ncbi:MAG: cardiolipin synthase [Muribaculaceae bacterium]|nr:cardiolipin synthase [Muribaculaceae bacterium]
MIETLASLLGTGWIFYILATLYVFTIVAIIIVVISENRNPVKSLAWVTVLLLLPFVGVLLYIFFGRSIKNKRMISRRNRRRLKKRELRMPRDKRPEGLSPESEQMIRLGRSLTGAPFHSGNDMTIFTNGRDKFSALRDDLRRARRSICLQYYIFSDDATGRELRDILIERARAGVNVRVIYDHVGSWSTSRKFFAEMTRAGISVYPFFKVTFPQLGTKLNWRNHRKICIIDGAIGYIGGMNIADRYIHGNSRFTTWRDTHVRLQGPAVASLLHSFAVDWNFMGQPLIDDIADPMALYGKGDVGMQLITTGPTHQWNDIEFAFQKIIATAKRRIYIQTPYFLPTDSLLKTLQAAALSHVDVRIMIPERSDSRMLTYATQSYISECLRAGIKIYRYRGGMLHCKTIIVDNELSTIGSSNFDFRSFEHNFEANLFVYSARINERMAEIFRFDMQHCERILPADWRRRPLPDKARQSLLRLLSPIL